MKINGNNIKSLVAVTLIMLPIMTSCRTELCYNHFASAELMLTYETEWERDYGAAHAAGWDAHALGHAYDELRPPTPEWVNMVQFTGGTTSSEHFLRSEGGEVRLAEEGARSFLLYNGDTEYIIISDIASLPDARASATSRSRSSISYVMERHPGIRSTNPPDILYASYIDPVPDAALHEVTPVPARMQPLVFTYLVRYEFEYGLESVAYARGALGGVAESVYLRNGHTSDQTAIILYDCDVTSYGCEAVVQSFGVPGFPDEYYGRQEDTPVPDRPYTLNLEVLLKNGRTVEFNYDIAEQMKLQPKGGVITVSGLRIEDEQSEPFDPSGSGFDVDLSGWDNVDVDFPFSANK